MPDPTPPEPSPDHRRPDLQALLRFWLPALGLTDWRVRATYERDLGAPDSMARVRVVWRYLTADVHVLDPAMVTVDWPPHDVERLVVHELVHCLGDCAFKAPEGRDEEHVERVVEQIALSLTRLRRVYPVPDEWVR